MAVSGANRKRYAAFRAGLAMDRLLAAETPEAKRQATRWALAWGIVAGWPTHRRTKLRTSQDDYFRENL